MFESATEVLVYEQRDGLFFEVEILFDGLDPSTAAIGASWKPQRKLSMPAAQSNNHVIKTPTMPPKLTRER